jgi:hypothetical protein
MNQPAEEIDLITLLKSIRKIIIKIAQLFVFAIKRTLTNYVLTLAIITASVSATLFFYYSFVPYYKSELIIINNSDVNNKNCKELISNLNNLVNKKENVPELSNKLSLSSLEAQKIKSITYASIDKQEDTDTSKVPFKVVVNVFDYQVLPHLQKGILNFLRTNDYVLITEKVENIELENLNLKITEDLKSLDSLKSKVIESTKSKTHGAGINITNSVAEPATLYKIGLELIKEKTKINKRQQLNSSFEALQNFVINKSPVTFSLLINVLIGVLIGYVISFLFAIFKPINNI